MSFSELSRRCKARFLLLAVNESFGGADSDGALAERLSILRHSEGPRFHQRAEESRADFTAMILRRCTQDPSIG